MSASGPVLVVQPSDDYACRVRRSHDDAVFLATPDRASVLERHPRVVAADLGSASASLDALADFSDRLGTGYGGIVCFICDYLHLTAQLAPSLGLSFHSEAAVGRSRLKNRAAEAWQAAGVPTPYSRPVRCLEDLERFCLEIPEGPWILKPTDRSGSEWVLRVDRPEYLTEAHRKIRRGLGGGDDVTYLAQAFVDGTEYSADVYLDGNGAHILRLTRKHLIPSPGLAGLVGAYFPARVESSLQRHIADAFGCAARVLGIEQGIVMGDAILCGDTVHILEMAARPGGDCLPDLCIAAWGYDPIREACRVALGQRPELPDLGNPEPVAALHLMAERDGVIARIDFSRLLAHPRVLQIEPYHEVGDAIRCWDGSYDDRILAACVVRCDDPSELPDLVDALGRRIDLDLEETADPVAGTPSSALTI